MKLANPDQLSATELRQVNLEIDIIELTLIACEPGSIEWPVWVGFGSLHPGPDDTVIFHRDPRFTEPKE